MPVGSVSPLACGLNDELLLQGGLSRVEPLPRGGVVIFNSEFLFLHVPKTGGMSLSRALLRSLSGKVYYTVPKGHARQEFCETILEGTRHEDLYQARDFFENRNLGVSLRRFETIFVMVRNPYDLEVSRFHYLQLGHPWDRGPAHRIAMTGDFREFARSAKPFFKIENYFVIDGCLPPNLRVMRLEDISSQRLNMAFGQYFEAPLELEAVNATKRKSFAEYFDKESEEMVYQRYKFLFDYGYYSRSLW